MNLLKGVRRNEWNVLLSLVSLAAVSVLGAPPQSTNAPSGYLRKAGPGMLRFAPAPLSQHAKLPPLPITPDPQPIATSNAPEASAPASATVRPATPPTAVKDKTADEPIVSTAGSSNAQANAQTTVDSSVVNPQLFLRYFPNGKPAGAGVFLGDPISFQIPVRETRLSSSASYEVK